MLESAQKSQEQPQPSNQTVAVCLPDAERSAQTKGTIPSDPAQNKGVDAAQPLYTDEQANEILRTAVRLTAPTEISFEEFVAAASELGISREELKQAEAEYKRNSSEEGQKAAFRNMQRHEFHLSIFHAALLGGIIMLIFLVDLRRVALYAAAVVVVIACAVLVARYRVLHNFESNRNKKAFEEWLKRKDVWLRPEKAKEIVDQTLKQTLVGHARGFDPPKARVIRSLRDALGYDKKRALAVFEAYMREHPEMEVRLGR